jgi:hypothetical protein
MFHGARIPQTTITILDASVEVLFGYGLIELGSWKSGAPSYSISSGKVVGK